MAAINFFSSQSNPIQNTLGSGLGFYGSTGFGASVAVGAYQGKTFITDSNGTVQGAEAWNTRFVNTSGVSIAEGGDLHILKTPNYQAPLNIRFTHSTAVKVQNAKVYIYDRSNINNNASGVTTKVAEIIHPDVVQTHSGSGDSTWYTPGGSSQTVPLANSPGVSGNYAGDGVTAVSSRPDVAHDWFVAISASPDSIGSKTLYGLYCALEYL